MGESRRGRPVADRERDLPTYWLTHLRALAADQFGSYEAFLRKVRLTERQIQRYQREAAIPLGRFGQMAELFQLTTDAFKRRLAGEDSRVVAPLTDPESKEAERRYLAYQHEGLYDYSAALAAECLDRAKVRNDAELEIGWYYRLASASRTRGDLRTASGAYNQALARLDADRARLRPRNADLVWEGRLRFGQTHNDVYQTRGAFAEAEQKYTELLVAAEQIPPTLSDSDRQRVLYGQLHLRRGVAEMTRFLGRYAEAAEASDRVAAQYPPLAESAAWWARLGAADALRLAGNLDGSDGAIARYRRLVADARAAGLGAEGRIGSALLRLARVHQIQENEKGYDAAVAEAMAIANEVPGRYRFLELYVDLVSAAGPGRNPIEAERSLKHAEESSGLAIDYLTLEYGHLWLCRGELARARIGRRDQANSAFAKAFAAYVATGCPWGILRAWIGLQLGGSRREVPLNPELLEGTDRRLWQAFQTVGNVRLGQLSMNLP